MHCAPLNCFAYRSLVSRMSPANRAGLRNKENSYNNLASPLQHGRKRPVSTVAEPGRRPKRIFPTRPGHAGKQSSGVQESDCNVKEIVHEAELARRRGLVKDIERLEIENRALDEQVKELKVRFQGLTSAKFEWLLCSLFWQKR